MPMQHLSRGQKYFDYEGSGRNVPPYQRNYLFGAPSQEIVCLYVDFFHC